MAGQSRQIYHSELSSEDEDDAQEEFQTGESKKQYEFKRSAIIYLLDSRKQMFSHDKLIEDEVPFVQCLRCIRNAMRSKIWAAERSLCAFVLLGTKKTDNALKLNNMVVVQGLKMLSAEHILNLDDVLKKVEDSSFEKEFGNEDFSLADAFWLCSKIFSDCGKNVNLHKKIILFTNDDNPTKNDRNELDRIINSAKDMVENKIIFDLIHLGENFNVNNMYKELVQLSREDMDYELPNPAVTLNDMIHRTNKGGYHYVSFSNVPFHVTYNYVCDVSVHYFIRKVKQPFKVKLSKATNELVTTKTQFFDSETGEVVGKKDLVYSYNIGGKEINFTTVSHTAWQAYDHICICGIYGYARQEEMQHIRKFSEKGLRLLGFKPAATLNLEHFVKPCAFIYPSNPNDAGNSEFFMALLTKCLERQTVPICTFCSRSGSNLEYVALLATEEEFETDKTQIVPSGFLIFFLPFAGKHYGVEKIDAVRDLDDKCTGKQRAGKGEVELAKKLIKKLKFNYKPEIFPNPKLACHWSAVEALALNLKEPGPFVDSALLQYEVMRGRTEAIARDLRDAIYTKGYDPEVGVPKAKTKPLKISKASEMGVEVDEGVVEAALRSGEVHKLTNDMLKLYLQQVGEGKGLSKAKKSDLIAKACKYLNISVP